MKLMTSVLLTLLTACALVAAPLPVFQKQVLTDKYFCDGITAGDLNRDGKMDIVAGPFWYEGPDFKLKHDFYPVSVQIVAGRDDFAERGSVSRSTLKATDAWDLSKRWAAGKAPAGHRPALLWLRLRRAALYPRFLTCRLRTTFCRLQVGDTAD